MSFSDIIGHQKQLEVLRRNIATGHIPPAYLFHGDEGIGKRTAAVEFARALNCEAPTPAGGCGQCRACRNITAGCHPNVRTVALEINPDTGKLRQAIVVAQVRSAQEFLSLKAVGAGAKALIVDGAHQLNEEAMNAFLKTLEEPPDNSFITLVTSRPARLLPTILSRCRAIGFQPLREADAAELLMRMKGYSPEQAGLVARFTGGRVGEALGCEPKELAKRREKALGVLEAVADGGPGAILKRAEEMSKKEDGAFEDFIFFAMGWFRDLLIILVGGGAALTYNRDIEGRLSPWTERVDADGCARALELLRETGRALEYTYNRRLLAEDLFFRMREEALG